MISLKKIILISSVNSIKEIFSKMLIVFEIMRGGSY
jgi:hypothetical protein